MPSCIYLPFLPALPPAFLPYLPFFPYPHRTPSHAFYPHHTTHLSVHGVAARTFCCCVRADSTPSPYPLYHYHASLPLIMSLSLSSSSPFPAAPCSHITPIASSPTPRSTLPLPHLPAPCPTPLHSAFPPLPLLPRISARVRTCCYAVVFMGGSLPFAVCEQPYLLSRTHSSVPTCTPSVLYCVYIAAHCMILPHTGYPAALPYVWLVIWLPRIPISYFPLPAYTCRLTLA